MLCYIFNNWSQALSKVRPSAWLEQQIKYLKLFQVPWNYFSSVKGERNWHISKIWSLAYQLKIAWIFLNFQICHQIRSVSDQFQEQVRATCLVFIHRTISGKRLSSHHCACITDALQRPAGRRRRTQQTLIEFNGLAILPCDWTRCLEMAVCSLEIVV